MAQTRGVPMFLYILHALIFMQYLYGLWLYLQLDLPHAKKSYGSHWKFLTFWNLIVQTVYFGLCVLNDVTGTNVKPWEDQKQRSWLQRQRDLIMNGLAFPLGTFVAIAFWGIYAVDRELVYPKSLDAVIPVWLNHFMHTMIIVWVVVDRYVTYHHPPSRKQGIGLMLLVAIGYQVWILWIAFYANLWVYPILRVLPWAGRAVFLVGLSLALAPVYFIGEKMTTAFWGSPKVIQGKKLK